MGSTLSTWLQGAIGRSFAAVFTAITGEPVEFAWQPASNFSAAEDVIYMQPFSVAPSAMLYTVAAPEAWQKLGARLLTSAGVDGTENDWRDTYQELLSQAFASLAREFAEILQREVNCGSGQVVQQAPPVGAVGTLLLSFPDGIECELLFVVPAALEGALTSKPTSPEKPADPMTFKEHRFDLLLDVELPVSISFGRSQIPLRDVIKLGTGSIVELNRSVAEPVEIIVNNCVIARGEVVVVEGNYGVRIQQIISRQERLRTLR